MWIKRGQIYTPDGSLSWAAADMGVLTPQPFLRNDGTIRVYGGFRDDAGASRIGYVDVAAENPSRILKVSIRPVLDLGTPGMFDDNGVILGDVIRVGDQVRMYYVGFQIPSRAKFMAFSGLAISDDDGETFVRHCSTPVMERSPDAPFIRAIHSVMKEDGEFRAWYSVGDGWEVIGGKPFPRYHIRTMKSPDGIHFSQQDGPVCLKPGPNEYRIGRPRVGRRPSGNYEMRYTFDTLDRKYMAGLARSADGLSWRRCDEQLGLAPGPESWDSNTVCYPVVLDAAGRRYCFYSGNGMGAAGFGYAVWSDGT